MSLQDQTPITEHTGNGVSTSFLYDFKIFLPEDIVVEANGVVLTYGVDYTLTGVGNNNGNVVFSVAPASTVPLTFYRDVAFERSTDYQYQGELPSSVVNNDIDRVWMAAQQLRQDLRRSLKLPFATFTDQELTQSAAERANMLLAFDSIGNITVVGASTGSATDLAINLANMVDPAKGAAMIGYNNATLKAVLDSVISSSLALKLKAAATIASAANTNISIATGNTGHISGAVNIAAWTMYVGQRMSLIFDGSLTLLYHPTNNKLPGGANIITVPGDTAVIYYDGTTVQILHYQRFDGTPVQDAQPSAVQYFAQNTPPPGWIKANGAALSRTVYAQLFAALVKSSTATISIATPGVVTWNAHGRSANDQVRFTTTGSLPTGLVINTDYYVVGASITANTFTLSATPGGPAIATSGTQSGVHTAINAPFGVGDGSTTFTLPDLRGEFVRGWDDGRVIDSNRAFGSSQLDAFQGHYHRLLMSSAGGVGSAPQSAATNTANNGLQTDFQGATIAVTDSTNGTPRISTETRPRNVALLACIKF